MRAKILMLAGDDSGRESLHASQRVLSTLAAAFGHSLIMKEAHWSDQTDFTSLSSDFDALAAFGIPQESDGLWISAGCFTGVQRHVWDERLGSLNRMKSGAQPAAILVWPLEDSQGHLMKAAVAACALARENGEAVWLIHPDRELDMWANAAAKAAMYAGLPAPASLRLSDAVARLLGGSRQAPIILRPRALPMPRRMIEKAVGNRSPDIYGPPD